MTGINGPLTGRVIGTRVVATHIAYRCERYAHDVNRQYVRAVKSQWWQPHLKATTDPYAVSECDDLVDTYPDTPPAHDFDHAERRYLRISHETHGIIIGQTNVADGTIRFGWGDDPTSWKQTRSIQLIQIATPSRDGNKLYPARIVLAHPNDIQVVGE